MSSEQHTKILFTLKKQEGGTQGMKLGVQPLDSSFSSSTEAGRQLPGSNLHGMRTVA